MTHHDDLDRELVSWFSDDATRRVPAGLLGAIEATARTRRQQPGWLVTLRGQSLGAGVVTGVGSRRLVLVVALAALLALVAALIAGRQQPTQFHMGLLAFVRDGDVYLANADGSNARIALSQDGVTFSTVSWSHDGQRLAIDGTSGVVLLTVATGKADLVGGSNPAWSPDGRALAVLDPTSTSSVDSVLRILDVASLSTSEAYPVKAIGGLTWSPNGRWLAANGGDAGNAVVRIDVASGEVVEIDAASGLLDSPRKVRWSPDSSHIAFVRYQELAGEMCGEPVHCHVDVIVADRDGSDALRVNATAGRADLPTWSPDGEWLAFREITRTAGNSAASGIHIVRPDGTDERNVVTARIRAIAWRPEGDGLVFTVDNETQVATIWQTSLDGDARPLDLSIDGGRTPYWVTSDGFAWQQLPGDSATPALPSVAPVLRSATPQLVTPAPAVPADPSLIWPVLASDEDSGCDPVTLRTASLERTLVAHLCEEGELRSASWSPTGRAYAVVKGVDFGPQDLVILRTDGSIAFELPLSLGSGIVWAPDGAHLGFVVDGDVWVVQQAGDGTWAVVKTEVAGAIDMVWSPDSRRIAVTTSNGTLLIGKPDGSDLRSSGSYPWPQRWAPDGSRFAFVRDGDVWLVNVDGTESHNVTGLPLGGALDASWSPDGTWLAVSTANAILLMSPDGLSRRWLDFGTAGLDDLFWSPDSTRLAVATSKPSSRVLIVSADGSPTVQIDEAAGPQWTPDGQFLLVRSVDGAGSGRGHLAVMNPDGSGRHELPIPPSEQGPMVWVQPG